jgi:Fe-S-cluster containining protein
MSENASIALLDECDVLADCVADAELIGLEIDIFGRSLRYIVAAANRRARLAEIVPVARRLSTNIALAVLGKLQEDGRVVPCRKGCSACCCYLIPLSVPEAFRLHQEFLAMDCEQRRSLLQSCLHTAKKLLDSGSTVSSANTAGGRFVFDSIQQLSHWYRRVNVACPLLSDGLCAAYAQRPTACREHIVTGSSRSCATPRVDQTELVRMPISISEALALMTAELEQSDIEAVMLPLVVPWADDNKARDLRTWPAPVLAETFVNTIKAMAAESDSVVVEASYSFLKCQRRRHLSN